MSTVIPFGEWLPDLPPIGLQGAITATNVTPDQQSYRTFPSLSVFSTSLGSRCRGGIYATDSTNISYNYAGDASALYALASTTYVDVTRAVGGAYTTATEDYWEFAQWGNTVIGVNGFTDLPQQISLGAANFANLSSGVKAKHITTMRDFVVLGNVSDSATAAYRVRWCAINNPTSWTVDTATLADFQDLPAEGGPIQKILGGEWGVVLQQRSIWRMQFVGSPLIFQFDKVHSQIGSYVSQGATRYQNLVFFLAEDGFYGFDGTALTPIGRGKVDKFFFDDLSINDINRISVAIDPTNKLVLWAYPSSAAAGGNPDKLLVYSWAYGRWALVSGIAIEFLLQSLQGSQTLATGYTLDGLDVLSTSLDALPLSLDSYDPASVGTGGRIILSAFNTSHVLSLFTGSAMAATLETGEFQLYKDNRAMLTAIRPIADGLSASVTLAVVSRNNLTESASVGTIATSPNATGFVECRISARYFRVRLVTSVGVEFTHLMGTEVDGVQAGVR